jgi:hypothetical protein
VKHVALPASVWMVALTTLVAATGYVLVGPQQHPSRFYNVAVAVERSLLGGREG